VLRDTVRASPTFQWLILGFLGLGLIIGVAALGVISARAVEERRQQIGVMRAIGFSDAWSS
jgi:putative ABC transport system permease protein